MCLLLLHSQHASSLCLHVWRSISSSYGRFFFVWASNFHRCVFQALSWNRLAALTDFYKCVSKQAVKWLMTPFLFLFSAPTLSQIEDQWTKNYKQVFDAEYLWNWNQHFNLGENTVSDGNRKGYLNGLCLSVCFFCNRSNASYRLKHRVSLQDIWLYGFEDEMQDEEGTMGDIDLRVTLVLAWDLTFCLVCFRWERTLDSQAMTCIQTTAH